MDAKIRKLVLETEQYPNKFFEESTLLIDEIKDFIIRELKLAINMNDDTASELLVYLSHYAQSENIEIKEEMTYRLKKYKK